MPWAAVPHSVAFGLELLAAERKAVIFVAHSIEEAVSVSDQIVLLRRRPGTVSEVIRPDLRRDGDLEQVRRDRAYLDCVDEIWRNRRLRGTLRAG